MVLKNPNEFQKERTLVYFVRHGERIHIPNKKEAGLEIPGPGLTKEGINQAKKVAKEFSRINNEIDAIYSSNMQRAIETATEISKVTGKKFKIIKGLSEINNIYNKKRYLQRSFWRDFIKHHSSLKVFDNILKNNKGKVIIIVGHGNIIKGIIGKKLGLSFKQISKFGHRNGNTTLMSFKGQKLDFIEYINSKELFY
jgi:broad specificity phosphatase PhoE